MTHTDPTAADLFRGVLLRPADDHARLVLADWLDEHAGSVPCPQCEGACKLYRTEVQGEIAHTALGGPVHKLGRGKVVECPTCHGTGTVSDGFAERAEFIRVQCELARQTPIPAIHHPLCLPGKINPTECKRCAWLYTLEPRWSELTKREAALFTDARRAEWFGIKCPACKGGEATPFGSAPGDCTHCAGTGIAPTDARRGFVFRVRCRMGDVFTEGYQWCHECAALVVQRGSRPGGATRPKCGTCDGGSRRVPILTPWAAGVLAAHPVTEWEIVDREPERTNPMEVDPIPSAVRSWFRDDGLGTTRSEILRIVFDALPGDGRHYVGDGEKCFRDEAEARTALAQAVGRVARRLAGLPEVTP